MVYAKFTKLFIVPWKLLESALYIESMIFHWAASVVMSFNKKKEEEEEKYQTACKNPSCSNNNNNERKKMRNCF